MGCGASVPQAQNHVHERPSSPVEAKHVAQLTATGMQENSARAEAHPLNADRALSRGATATDVLHEPSGQLVMLNGGRSTTAPSLTHSSESPMANKQGSDAELLDFVFFNSGQGDRGSLFFSLGGWEDGSHGYDTFILPWNAAITRHHVPSGNQAPIHRVSTLAEFCS
jgi:hypothetical protein